MQQVRLKWLTRDLTAGQQIGSHRLHGGIGSRNFELRLGVFGLFFLSGIGVVEHDGDQRIGFDAGRGGEK